jgi:hypothetical protein
MNLFRKQQKEWRIMRMYQATVMTICKMSKKEPNNPQVTLEKKVRHLI